MRNFCRSHASSFDWSAGVLPCRWSVGAALQVAKASAPGPDGIPAHAWKAAGARGTAILTDVCYSLMNGGRLPDMWNASLAIFPPKHATSLEQALGAVRQPDDTRPLNLKNNDNKAVASAVNFSFSAAVAAQAHSAQRGFLAGRVPALNVVELDARLREAAATHTEIPHAAPGGVLFDFKSAFPSVSHKYLFCLLRVLGLPSALLTILSHFYIAAIAFSVIDHIKLYEAKSGVLQGCPLSGTLFALVLDPFLALLDTVVQREGGLLRAAADDIAMILRCLSVLREIERHFASFRRHSLLALKPAKCVIVVAEGPATQSRVERIKVVLNRYTPAWSAFAIRDVAVYLGWRIGAKAMQETWRAAVLKYRERISALVATRAPAHLAANLYNTFVVSLLSYLPIFGKPPPELGTIERSAVHRILRWPQNSLASGALWNLHTAGGPKFNSIRAMVFATAVSFAAKHETVLVALRASLIEVATYAFPFRRVLRGCLAPPGYDTRASVVYLLEALM